MPLWSGISCDLFEIEELTSSSSNVESDFKNIKQILADKIPCSMDVFVEEHIELLRGATIEASQRHDYVKFMRNENNQTEKSNDKGKNEHIKLNTINQENVDENLSHSVTPTSGCKNGGEPRGAHRCIECKKAVHILPCCSISIGDEEGYGEKRLCNVCANAQKTLQRQSPVPSVTQAISEMEYNESWNKTKKIKQVNI